MNKRFLSAYILISLTLHGCQSLDTKNSLLSHQILAEMSKSNQLDTLSPQEIRANKLADLNTRFKNMEIDLQRAITYSVYLQKQNYAKRKRIGAFGSFLGVVATTLNAASKANIVTSTAFTGLQTVTMGYITNDNTQYIDPHSYEEMQKIRNSLRESFIAYQTNYKSLLTTNLNNNDWDKLYLETVMLLEKIKFDMNIILPPEDFTDKRNQLNGSNE
ncbi:hypothetical protein QDS99_003601 [Acinetobacter baumannii]|uniref:hypothetical protein n=1 Tax=Acinetobacter baumannii TaxID=470 RepID=UPI000F737852|nr:hypothetical protein [Acinetobacter baumannii]EHZ6744146.1 hypothetical protein [Acinetobacter baumannii]EHZ6755512.1 hypothetical protein [Acinetobacter baumannii]EHZ7537012.1 hypothetical protein [Acinetobacter baumannii]EHZ7932096.1 hypothetical protein [Acinetobacter baumannii]EHZ7980011.1 hypothetical protein [Acinetobacter baumannii]